MSDTLDNATLSRRKRKFSHDEIGTLYSKGYTSTEVARMIGCSVALVLHVVHIQRIARNQRSSHPVKTLTDEQRGQIMGYRQRGWAWIRIAAVMNVSAKTMIKQCKGVSFDKLTNCHRCSRVIVNAHQTQKYCDECADTIKRENARFYNEQYQKRLRGEIEEGEE